VGEGALLGIAQEEGDLDEGDLGPPEVAQGGLPPEIVEEGAVGGPLLPQLVLQVAGADGQLAGDGGQPGRSPAPTSARAA
jgi:hypothetical protein